MGGPSPTRQQYLTGNKKAGKPKAPLPVIAPPANAPWDEAAARQAAVDRNKPSPPAMRPMPTGTGRVQTSPGNAAPFGDPVAQYLQAMHELDLRSKERHGASGDWATGEVTLGATPLSRPNGSFTDPSAITTAAGGSPTGAAGAATSGGVGAPYDQAAQQLQDQNVAAQHAIAQGLVDFLKRSAASAADYRKQAGQIGQDQQADLASTVKQSDAIGQPILNDLKSQGVDPSAVQSVLGANKDTLTTQGGLQQEFLNRQKQLMEGSIQDANDAGQLVAQGGQATRENTLAGGLAQLALQKSQAQSAMDLAGYKADLSAAGKTTTLTKEQALSQYTAGFGPKAQQAWQTLYTSTGGNPAKIMEAVNSRSADEWAKVGLPNMQQFAQGAVQVLLQGDQKVPLSASSGGISPSEQWIMNHESSGGNVNADNPKSTAFGVGQLLESNRKKYLGADYNTTDYNKQLQAMRAYIADRYGTADAAVKFWQQHGWY